MVMFKRKKLIEWKLRLRVCGFLFIVPVAFYFVFEHVAPPVVNAFSFGVLAGVGEVRARINVLALVKESFYFFSNTQII